MSLPEMAIIALLSLSDDLLLPAREPPEPVWKLLLLLLLLLEVGFPVRREDIGTVPCWPHSDSRPSFSLLFAIVNADILPVVPLETLFLLDSF